MCDLFGAQRVRLGRQDPTFIALFGQTQNTLLT
jgi:hypothetical protein